MFRLLRPVSAWPYAPETIRRHSFCTTDNLFPTVLGRSLSSAAKCHTAESQVIAGLIAAVLENNKDNTR